MSYNKRRFQVIMLEQEQPVGFWHGTPLRDGSTNVSVQLEENVNVLAVAEILLGLAVELLPDNVKPKGMVLREILRQYITGDDEDDAPW